MSFDISYVIQQWPALLEGLWVTLAVSAVSIVLALLVGVAGVTVRMLRVPVLSQLCTGYVEVVRNTPLLAQIFFIFYGLPVIGVQLSMFWSGVVTLVLWGGAYQIENLRGGLHTVTSRQLEASFALGLSYAEFVRLIALSIALRNSVPSMLNTAVSMLKNSAFLQAVGLAELTYVAIDRIASDFRTMEMLAVLGVTYLILVLLMAGFAHWLQRVLRKPFTG